MSDSDKNQFSDSFFLPIHSGLYDYTILKVLGHGGFGVTYLVRDKGLDCDCVLKENLPRVFCERDRTTMRVSALPGDEASANYQWALDRFKKEARTLAKLNHPNIVRVLRVFETLGTAYYVMPSVGGCELGDAVKQASNGVSETYLAPILKQLLEALAYIHRKGLLHRDLKPSNILISEEGVPIIIDFGAARAAMSSHTQTALETPGYTPFEQIQTHGNIGPWTDLYALGATFYKLITGNLPPRGIDRLTDDQCYQPLSARRDLQEHFSRRFLESIDKALGVRPEQRWQTAQEWTDALSETSVRQENEARPTPPTAQPVQADRPKKGHHRWIFLTALIILLLAVAAVKFTDNPTSATAEVPPLDEGSSQVIAKSPEDSAETETRYPRAAEQVDTKTENNLVKIQDEGRSVSKDVRESEAVKLYRKKAEQGDSEVQNNLGVIHAEDFGISRDDAEAVKWYRKAAEQNFAWAQFGLGMIYAEGLGVSRDDAEAVKWYRKAAEQNFAYAQSNLGVMYSQGQGVSRDDAEAVKLYRKAAEQGNAMAQYNLGIMYEKGCGVSKDATAAVKWYRKAAERGNEMAKRALECLEDPK